MKNVVISMLLGYVVTTLPIWSCSNTEFFIIALFMTVVFYIGLYGVEEKIKKWRKYYARNKTVKS